MTAPLHSRRGLLLLFVALTLAACAPKPAPVSPAPIVKPKPLGDFKLGFAVAVADKVKKGPLSRNATQDELVTAMKTELDRVFGAYEGSKFYNLGVSIDAYVLARPGIPIVASPSSALIVTLNVWDDAKAKMILDKPKQFTVLEKLSGKTLFGSGLTKTREQQLAELTQAAVKQMEDWLHANESLFQHGKDKAVKPATKS